MAFKRYYPSRDTSVANYDPAAGSKDVSFANVGASEILNLYQTTEGGSARVRSYSVGEYLTSSIFPEGAYYPVSGSYLSGVAAFSGALHWSGSVYQLAPGAGVAKVLIDFVDPIVIPSSGSPAVFMKLFDAQHDQTLPVGYTVIVRPVEQDWTEGAGHDLDFYTDLGVANFLSATLSSAWVSPTGTASATFSRFVTGHEDLEIDLTGILISSAGFEIYIDPSLSGSDLYIKKFHSRQSHFPTKRPFIEVRWNDFVSGPLSTTPVLLVTASGPWSGSYVEKWNTSSFGCVTASVTNSLVDPTGALNFSLYDLKPVYDSSEVTRLHLYAQPKAWNPAETLSASSGLSGTVLTNAYYRVVDAVTDEVLVPFGSGSPAYTKMSYDDRGNYFDFYMPNMPTGTLLRFDFEYDISGTRTFVAGDEFKFRVR